MAAEEQVCLRIRLTAKLDAVSPSSSLIQTFVLNASVLDSRIQS